MVTVPTADEFYAGMLELLPRRPVSKAGKFKGVSRFADQARAYLLSVVPDPCYDTMYASAWGVATALQQWRDEALKQPEKLLLNTFSQFVESPQAILAEPVAGNSRTDATSAMTGGRVIRRVRLVQRWASLTNSCVTPRPVVRAGDDAEPGLDGELPATVMSSRGHLPKYRGTHDTRASTAIRTPDRLCSSSGRGPAAVTASPTPVTDLELVDRP